MEVIIEHPETGETKTLRPLPNGRFPNFSAPWRVKGTPGGIKRKVEQEARVVALDDKLNKLAAMLFIPAADVARVVGKALGLECAACQVRFQIWKKAQEIGWKQVMWLTWKSIRAQANHDEAQLEEMAKELEG